MCFFVSSHCECHSWLCLYSGFLKWEEFWEYKAIIFYQDATEWDILSYV